MTDSAYAIHDEADYEKALAEYEAYFDHEPEAGSDAGHRCEMLGLAISEYENRT